MQLDYDTLMSRRIDDRRCSYTDTQALLYNISIGMGRDPLDEREFPFVYEKPELRVVPTAATVLGSGDGDGGGLLDNVGIDWTGLVHGEQRMTFYRPIPAAAELVRSVRIPEIIDKGEGRGALITMAMDANLASGEPVYTSENVMFARFNGGFGGSSQSSKEPHRLPDREPDLVHVSRTREDQALLYRLTGDRHALHADPEFAKRAGFPRPILHGFCTYGIACRAMLASVCDYDPGRIQQFDVRFSSPVFPGDTIHTDMWIDGETVSFRSRVAEREALVLNNGLCVLNEV